MQVRHIISLFALIGLQVHAANSLMALRQGGIDETIGSADFKGTADAGHANPDVCNYDPINPAASAFCEQVGFGATVSFEDFEASPQSGGTLASSQMALRQFKMIFPNRWFAVGLGYDQTSPRDVSFGDSINSEAITGGKAIFSGSLATSFTNLGLSVGIFGAYLNGSTHETSILNDIGAEPTQRWSRSIIDEYSGYQTGASLDWRVQSLSAYISGTYHTAWTAKRTSQLFQTIGDTNHTIDDLSGSLSMPEIDLSLGTDSLPSYSVYDFGFKWQIDELDAFSLDGEWGDISRKTTDLPDPNGLNPLTESKTIADQNPWRVSAGYSWGGSKRFYAPLWRKTIYRVGASVRSLGFEDAMEYKGSVGAGIPLGTRGSRIDLALDAGLRQATNYGDEKFVTLWFTLDGFGNWGQPSRRYR